MNKNIFSKIFSSINVSLTIILLIINLVILCKPLYYNKIESLNLTTFNNKGAIIEDYDYMIKYIYELPLNSNSPDFTLPNLHSSQEGKSHFKDVQKIVFSMNVLFLVNCITSVFIAIKSYKKRSHVLLRNTSITLLIIPLTIILPIILDFNSTFTIFHKLLFSNDNWLFDPLFDPIINILPQEFFMSMSIYIITSIVITSVFLYLLYLRLNFIN
ncbi:MAG: TIGR01906 family membrane protein, partial [Clostridium sp.]